MVRTIVASDIDIGHDRHKRIRIAGDSAVAYLNADIGIRTESLRGGRRIDRVVSAIAAEEEIPSGAAGPFFRAVILATTERE